MALGDLSIDSSVLSSVQSTHRTTAPSYILCEKNWGPFFRTIAPHTTCEHSGAWLTSTLVYHSMQCLKVVILKMFIWVLACCCCCTHSREAPPPTTHHQDRRFQWWWGSGEMMTSLPSARPTMRWRSSAVVAMQHTGELVTNLCTTLKLHMCVCMCVRESSEQSKQPLIRIKKRKEERERGGEREREIMVQAFQRPWESERERDRRDGSSYLCSCRTMTTPFSPPVTINCEHVTGSYVKIMWPSLSILTKKMEHFSIRIVGLSWLLSTEQEADKIPFIDVAASDKPSIYRIQMYAIVLLIAMRVLGRVETQAQRRDNTLEYKAMWPVGERASKWMGCLCGCMIDRTYRPWRAVCTSTVPSQEALTTTSSCWLMNCQHFFLIITLKHLRKRRVENLCIDSDAGHLIIVAVLKEI